MTCAHCLCTRVSKAKHGDKVIVHTAKRKLDPELQSSAIEQSAKRKDNRGRPRKGADHSFRSSPAHAPVVTSVGYLYLPFYRFFV